MNNQPTSPERSPETPKMSPTPTSPESPLPEATNLEDVANNLEKILERTKSSPTKEVDGFVLVKEDAGLLEAAVAQIRAFKQQPQPQEKPRSFLNTISFGLFKGGKKTRKNRGKKQRKNKTKRNKSVNKQKKHRK